MSTATLGRPPLPSRSALLSVLREAGPLCLSDAARRAQVDIDAAENAVRAGLLQVVRYEKQPQSRKWVALYDVATPTPTPERRDPHGWALLAGSLQRWAR